MVSKDCSVCHEHEGKYRCRLCRMQYCSIPCSKAHVLVCQAVAGSGTTPGSAPAERSSKPVGRIVPPDMSAAVAALEANPALRARVVALARGDSIEAVAHARTLEPEFDSFVQQSVLPLVEARKSEARK